MSVNNTHPRTISNATCGRIKKSSGAFQRWLGGAFRNWRRCKMMAALSTLDDRMLMDIGIHRGEIERVVDGFDDREMQMTPVAPAAKPVAIAPETLPRAA